VGIVAWLLRQVLVTQPDAIAAVVVAAVAVVVAAAAAAS
jgi:hypothetical protein